MIVPWHHPLQLVIGPVVWAVWFVALYGGLSVACERSAPSLDHGALTWINGSLWLLTLVVTIVLLVWTRRCWLAASQMRDQPRFIAQISAGAHGVSALATLAVGLPVMVLPPCL